MTERDDRDEALVDELRDLFAQTDPVPPIVTEAAKASLSWRRLDAELAELLNDSALEEGSLAGARGEAPIRSVSFSARAKTIDLEIHLEGEQRVLLGQIAPPVRSQIEIQTPDSDRATTAQSDELGRFRARLPAGGLIRLIIEDGAEAGPKIATSWITI